MTTSFPPRIGGTERQRPALKYANPKGECSRIGCNNSLRRAPDGWYGRFCNPCSRLLLEHGDFNTTVPRLKDESIALLYQTTMDVVLDMVRKQDREIAGHAWSIQRCEEYAGRPGMGDPLLALRSDTWLYHHYIHHKLKTQEQAPLDVLLHLVGVVGVTQLGPQYFATPDQMDLFLVKRGLGHGLPSIRVSASGKPAPHGRWSMRRARLLARKLRGDWGLGPQSQGRVAEEVLRRVGRG
ncbi:hypothetical protein [Motiliproteus sp.]|uniref:hypothetical protein n=1 Tax=Motiliproteus sp. TaxID=1898955 RepID=UPI003BAB5B5F